MAFKIDPEAYYTPAEYAEIIGEKQSTQAKKRSLGTGCRFVKHGKNVFYRGSDILARLHDRTVAHGAEYRERFGGEGGSNG